jgi:hypothetical protein
LIFRNKTTRLSADSFVAVKPLGTDEELDQYLLGISYKLAKGVALNAYGAYVEFDEDVSDGGGGSGDDIDAWVIGTAVKISF